VQRGDVVEGALGLDDQQPVERLGGDLRAELAHRLLAAVAGEQQQAVPLGLEHVDRALDHLADPRPGERGHQHADHPRTPAGQADGARAGHVTELVDHRPDPRGGRLVQLTLAVEHSGHGRLADLGPGRHIGDGDWHWSSTGLPVVSPLRCAEMSEPVSEAVSAVNASEAGHVNGDHRLFRFQCDYGPSMGL
jgi:hypothetical protein